MRPERSPQRLTGGDTASLGRLLFTNQANGNASIVYVVSPGYLVFLNTTPNKIKTASTILQSQQRTPRPSCISTLLSL
jgi:hypothetical protein